jgi:hypothetical protein
LSQMQQKGAAVTQQPPDGAVGRCLDGNIDPVVCTHIVSDVLW